MAGPTGIIWVVITITLTFENPFSQCQKIHSKYCVSVTAAELWELQHEYSAKQRRNLAVQGHDSEVEVSEYENPSDDEEQAAIDRLTDAQLENQRSKKSKSKSSKSKSKSKRSKTQKKRPQESDISDAESEPGRSLDAGSFHQDKREQRIMAFTCNSS